MQVQHLPRMSQTSLSLEGYPTEYSILKIDVVMFNVTENLFKT